MNNLKRLKKYTILLVLMFVIIVTSSVIFDISNITKKQNNLALKKAQNAFEKNMMFRNWVSMHNGIYVFTSKDTPSNPYLRHEKKDLITTSGERLTLMNPSYVLKELMEKFSGMDGEKGHLTSLNLLNPNNKADEWESKILKNFYEKKYSEYSEIYNYKNKEQLRFMKALETKQSCLKCHASQGYNLGDIRGGISITIPMKKYNDIGYLEKKFIIALHTIMLIIGTILIFIVYSKIKNSIKTEILLENEIRKKEEILTNQSKMAALGEMIGNIAHQWRQPLSAISVSASGIKVQNEFGLLDDKELNYSIAGILNSTKYLSQTIDDFRDFIKGDKKETSFNLSKNINKNLGILQGSLKIDNITVILDCDEDIDINNYPNELTQVFINIINNAKDALEENKIKERYIFVSLKKEKETALLIIKDNANGIAENIIDKIFDPYFTTKDKAMGTGLGLYMSYKIINESMNSKIEVSNTSYVFDNKKFVGAEFIITLPLKNNS